MVRKSMILAVLLLVAILAMTACQPKEPPVSQNPGETGNPPSGTPTTPTTPTGSGNTSNPTTTPSEPAESLNYLVDLLGWTKVEVLKSCGSPSYEREDGTIMGYEPDDKYYSYEFTLSNGVVSELILGGPYDKSVSLLGVAIGASESEAKQELGSGSKSGSVIEWDTGDLLVTAEVHPDSKMVMTLRVSLKPITSTYYSNETVHGQFIDHAEYRAVVIENYEGNNFEILNGISLENPAYPVEPWTSYSFAVFGTISDVTVITTKQMGGSEQVFQLAEEISDAVVTVRSNFPTDFSVDVITFKGPDGEIYDFAVEDVTDNYAVIAIR